MYYCCMVFEVVLTSGTMPLPTGEQRHESEILLMEKLVKCAELEVWIKFVSYKTL